jgi:hypothetical protein
MNYVLDSQGGDSSGVFLSSRCMTNCLMFLVRANELSAQFVEKRGFPML